jgi:hypothetical protein
MMKIFYDKTDKGRLEISSRQFKLSSKLRPLLVIVDGKHATAALLKSVAGLGLDESSLVKLEIQGFIVAREEELAVIPETPESLIDAAVNGLPVPAENVTSTPVQSHTEKLLEIKNLYSDTIKNALGIRGFGLQLKVEKAGTLNDFVSLRRPLLEAVLKSKGEESARDLHRQLVRLLTSDIVGASSSE